MLPEVSGRVGEYNLAIIYDNGRLGYIEYMILLQVEYIKYSHPGYMYFTNLYIYANYNLLIFIYQLLC